jgi:hypothetical protein
VWTYGFARDGQSCKRPADFIFIADGSGRILCVSRLGRWMAWDVPEEARGPLGAHKDATFNFSLPACWSIRRGYLLGLHLDACYANTRAAFGPSRGAQLSPWMPFRFPPGFDA